MTTPAIDRYASQKALLRAAVSNSGLSFRALGERMGVSQTAIWLAANKPGAAVTPELWAKVQDALKIPVKDIQEAVRKDWEARFKRARESQA